jgi:hypothetical protein
MIYNEDNEYSIMKKTNFFLHIEVLEQYTYTVPNDFLMCGVLFVYAGNITRLSRCFYMTTLPSYAYQKLRKQLPGKLGKMG